MSKLINTSNDNRYEELTINALENIVDRLSKLEQVKTSPLDTVYDHIEIDSTYRNRTEYPLASEFIVPYTNASPGINAFNSIDPISLAFPYSAGTYASIINAQAIQFTGSRVSTVDNFYVNSYLNTVTGTTYTTTGALFNDFSLIIGYTGSTQTAILQTPFYTTPLTNQEFLIRKQRSMFSGQVQDSLISTSTTTAISLSSGASSYSDAYKGNYLYFTTGLNKGSYGLIYDYRGNTGASLADYPVGPTGGKVAYINQIMTLDPTTLNYVKASELSYTPSAGDFIDIDGWSYDNWAPLRYSGSRTINQSICYAMIMTDITIPTITLSVGNGGTIFDYPYVFVHFYNYPNPNNIVIYGNSIRGASATFKVPIDGTSKTPNFVVISSKGETSPQTLKFCLSQNVFFRVTLPNGENLQFVQPDFPPPYQPNGFTQISATFALRRIIS